MANGLKVTFKAHDINHHGCSEWYVYLNGVCAGTLDRDTPTRWHNNGVSGIVQDQDAAKIWTAYFYEFEGDDASPVDSSINNERICQIPPGATASEAKRLVKAAILERFGAKPDAAAAFAERRSAFEDAIEALDRLYRSNDFMLLNTPEARAEADRVATATDIIKEQQRAFMSGPQAERAGFLTPKQD